MNSQRYQGKAPWQEARLHLGQRWKVKGVHAEQTAEGTKAKHHDKKHAWANGGVRNEARHEGSSALFNQGLQNSSQLLGVLQVYQHTNMCVCTRMPTHRPLSLMPPLPSPPPFSLHPTPSFSIPPPLSSIHIPLFLLSPPFLPTTPLPISVLPPSPNTLTPHPPLLPIPLLPPFPNTLTPCPPSPNTLTPCPPSPNTLTPHPPSPNTLTPHPPSPNTLTPPLPIPLPPPLLSIPLLPAPLLPIPLLPPPLSQYPYSPLPIPLLPPFSKYPPPPPPLLPIPFLPLNPPPPQPLTPPFSQYPFSPLPLPPPTPPLPCSASFLPHLWQRPVWQRRRLVWLGAVAQMVHASRPHAHVGGGVGAVVLQGRGGAEGVGVVPGPAEVLLVKLQWRGVPSLRALQVAVAARLKGTGLSLSHRGQGTHARTHARTHTHTHTHTLSHRDQGQRGREANTSKRLQQQHPRCIGPTGWCGATVLFLWPCLKTHLSQDTINFKLQALVYGTDSCMEIKECPSTGVTKSGRVWRKALESDAHSVNQLFSLL